MKKLNQGGSVFRVLVTSATGSSQTTAQCILYTGCLLLKERKKEKDRMKLNLLYSSTCSTRLFCNLWLPPSPIGKSLTTLSCLLKNTFFALAPSCNPGPAGTEPENYTKPPLPFLAVGLKPKRKLLAESLVFSAEPLFADRFMRGFSTLEIRQFIKDHTGNQ